MASFVLVHGSGQNAASWDRVAGLLRARGHAVVAPDLPKHAAEWGLRDHAREIARSIADPRTVVVAHSFSGVLLPLVAETRDCGLLIFLAAVIPEPGKSVRQQFGEDPEMFSKDWIAAGPRWFDETQQEQVAREFLFHDCDPETAAWALRSVESYDTKKLITEPSPFTAWPRVSTASIVATADRTISPDWGLRMTRRVLGKAPIEIDAGHCPQVSRPNDVAIVLAELAAESE